MQTGLTFPSAIVVEQRLKHIAGEMGDATLKPFRVDLVAVHGGKPPTYSVVILSYNDARLRRRLEDLLRRPIACGLKGFMIQAHEAQHIVGNSDA